MKKSAGPGKCVHCLRSVPERNWDHIFPVSWYPNTTPQNMEKWKVPSCYRCNKEYGIIEEDLLLHFGLCLNPHDENTKNIVEKARRSIDPKYGKNNKDKKARAKKRKKILKELIEYEKIPHESIFPNFGPHQNTDGKKQAGLLLRKEHIEKIAIKFVKGLIYFEYDKYLDEDYNLELHVMEKSSAIPFNELINKYGNELNRGPGFVVNKAVVPDDPRIGIYEILIWQKAILYVSVTDNNCIENDGKSLPLSF